jgi:hypothetical protein
MLAFEKLWNPTLNSERFGFVEKITSEMPPKPPAIESKLRANQGRA